VGASVGLSVCGGTDEQCRELIHQFLDLALYAHGDKVRASKAAAAAISKVMAGLEEMAEQKADPRLSAAAEQVYRVFEEGLDKGA
jgi:hypothetical protein